MIYFETNENGLVTMQHFMPELLSEERKAKGFEVESIPEPEEREGFYPELYYRNNKFEYEYKEIPPAPESVEEQEKKALESRIKALEGTVKDLITADLSDETLDL